ncbi:MAG: glycosyltransferase [Armatimonadaceae bacterium]
MKIRIVASGTRGDVQPYVALGQGLRRAGHMVHLLTSDDFEAMVCHAGLEFVSSGSQVEALLQNPEWRELMNRGNFLAILARMRREMEAQGKEAARRLPEFLEGADLLIAGVGGMGGAFTAAEHFRIPTVAAYLFPLTPTRQFPCPILPDLPRLPIQPLLNRISFRALQEMLWLSVRSADSAVRQELHLSSSPLRMPFPDTERHRLGVLYGYSRHVLPAPDDWHSHCHITGYWFLEEAEKKLPDDLEAFLNDGAPPVYIGFGSMGSQNPEETTKLALRALEESGQRGVLVTGWGGLSADSVPPTVFVARSVPHGALFPRTAAVVHHGGAGTTGAGLRAGVPNVVVPFFGDQPFWGRQVARLGVGTPPLSRKRLTASALADAIRRCMEDTELRAQAADLGQRIREENGVDRAVARIEQYAALATN